MEHRLAFRCLPADGGQGGPQHADHGQARVAGLPRQVQEAQGTQGLVEAMRVVGNIEGISFVYFDERDVVRHKLVQDIVKAYESFSNGAQKA